MVMLHDLITLSHSHKRTETRVVSGCDERFFNRGVWFCFICFWSYLYHSVDDDDVCAGWAFLGLIEVVCIYDLIK